MPKEKVGDINMYYEIHGDGEPLVVINGAGVSSDLSYPLIPIYSSKYQMVLFDNRGAGQTDAPDIPYTYKMMADDLAGLLDFLSIGSAHIWGTSMGGMIAQHFALHYPERVRSLVLACTSCGGPRSIGADPEVIEAGQRLQGLSVKELMMETTRLGVSQEWMDNNPEELEQILVLMMKHPISPKGQMRQMEALMSHDTYERLSDIKAPTLVIHGDADKLIPVENAKIIASNIPGAELVILENMGHFFIIEASEESNRIILEFLSRHKS